GTGRMVAQIVQRERVIRMLPPSAPYDKIYTEVQKLDIDVPDGQTRAYYVQLPPDYHPYRSYPVLLAVHRAREKPAEMIQRFTELAAHYGFIVAAPIWGKGLQPSYNYPPHEHAMVLHPLRHLPLPFHAHC